MEVCRLMQPRSRKLCHSLTLLRIPSTPIAASEWSKTHPPLLCFSTAGCINTDSQHFWCYLQNEWAACSCSHSLCTQPEWDCPLFFTRRKRLLFACLAFLFFSAGKRQMKLFMCSSLQKAKSLSEKSPLSGGSAPWMVKTSSNLTQSEPKLSETFD